MLWQRTRKTMGPRWAVRCTYTRGSHFGSLFILVAVVSLFLSVLQGVIKGSPFFFFDSMGGGALFARRIVTLTAGNPISSQSACWSSSGFPSIRCPFSETFLRPRFRSSPSCTSSWDSHVTSSVPFPVPVVCLLSTFLRRSSSASSWQMTPGHAAPPPPPAYRFLAVISPRSVEQNCYRAQCAVPPSSSSSTASSSGSYCSPRVSWSALSPCPFSFWGPTSSSLQSGPASPEFLSDSRSPPSHVPCEGLASRNAEENEKVRPARVAAISYSSSSPPFPSLRPVCPAITRTSALATTVPRWWSSPSETQQRKSGDSSSQSRAPTTASVDEHTHTSNDANDEPATGRIADSLETPEQNGERKPRERGEAGGTREEASTGETMHDREERKSFDYAGTGKNDAARATGRSHMWAGTESNEIPNAESRAAYPVHSPENARRDELEGKEQGDSEEQRKPETHREHTKDQIGYPHRTVRSGKEKQNEGLRDAIAMRHLQRRFSPGHANYRIQKELQAFLSNPPPNCRVYVHPSNIRVWLIEMTGMEGSPYANEMYRLKVVIPPDYPFSPPTCFFLQPAPVHVHVYSNGDVCLNLLGSDWRPSLSISAIAVAILSMLTSAKQKQLPTDNAAHMDVPAGHHGTQFLYHDDKV
ncbi:putative ubiquitin conjugating enzyme E2 [Toxoplasma gondii RUB]|uniref:Putative ubiquitin conjugating enzyme E2 n=1 Tax=Toxoplasma gondii RUB TaxID=935652 RepID=A0A086LLK4_TOXGO|nr:putative ubiquitin conjugating enzyme E2 [Toxoplasma gondii RUB]